MYNVTRSEGYQVNDTQEQVDQVMGIMRNNIDKVLERDTKIQNLNERSGETKLFFPF